MRFWPRWATRAVGLFRRGDLPELPPEEFRTDTVPEGWTLREFDNWADLQAWGKANRIIAGTAYNPKRYLGGVAPNAREIGLPTPQLINDPERYQALRWHEIGAHADGGLVHDHGGKGWGVNGPDGKFYPVQTRAELAALQGQWAQAKVKHDWAGAFAKPEPPRGLLGSSARRR